MSSYQDIVNDRFMVWSAIFVFGFTIIMSIIVTTLILVDLSNSPEVFNCAVSEMRIWHGRGC